MKTHYVFILCIATLFSMQSLQAKVIIVNNNEGQPADFKELQVAIDDDGTKDGDIIYLVGSPNYYDGTQTIRVNKSLTIVGLGYFLSENDEIKTQASNTTAKIHEIYVGAGADGAILTGLDIDVSNNSSVTVGNRNRDINTRGEAPEGVTLVRNKINQVLVGEATGTIIKENYISYTGNSIILYEESSNTFITNNLILSGNSYAAIYGIDNVGLKGTIIKNNTLSNGLYRIHSLDDIYNNIFIQGGLRDCTNNTLKNNVFSASEESFLTGTSPGTNTYKTHNNQFGKSASTFFKEETPVLDKDYQLGDGSPAIGAGIEGDAGAFTQDDNTYKISGLPAVPAIYELTTQGVGTAADGMKVTIKAKSHN